MSQKNFQSEKLVGRKNFKKQIGEIKKFTRKILTERNFIKWKKQKMYIQIKKLAYYFLKKFCMQRTKKLDLGRGRRWWRAPPPLPAHRASRRAPPPLAPPDPPRVGPPLVPPAPPRLTPPLASRRSPGSAAAARGGAAPGSRRRNPEKGDRGRKRAGEEEGESREWGAVGRGDM